MDPLLSADPKTVEDYRNAAHFWQARAGELDEKLASLTKLVSLYLSYGSTDGKVERQALRVELAKQAKP